MAAPNTIPIWTLTPKRWRSRVTAANVKSDGTGTVGTDMSTFMTAGTQGSYISSIRIMVTASAAATATVATVIRIYVTTITPTGGAVTSNADTDLLIEVGLPIITADATTAQTNAFDVAMPEGGVAMQAGQSLIVSSHIAAAANTDWRLQAFGGDY